MGDKGMVRGIDFGSDDTPIDGESVPWQVPSGARVHDVREQHATARDTGSGLQSRPQRDAAGTDRFQGRESAAQDAAPHARPADTPMPMSWPPVWEQGDSPDAPEELDGGEVVPTIPERWASYEASPVQGHGRAYVAEDAWESQGDVSPLDEEVSNNSLATIAIVNGVLAIIFGLIPAIGIYLMPVPALVGLGTGFIGFVHSKWDKEHRGTGRAVAGMLLVLAAIIATPIAQTGYVTFGVLQAETHDGMMTLTLPLGG